MMGYKDKKHSLAGQGCSKFVKRANLFECEHSHTCSLFFFGGGHCVTLNNAGIEESTETRTTIKNCFTKVSQYLY